MSEVSYLRKLVALPTAVIAVALVTLALTLWFNAAHLLPDHPHGPMLLRVTALTAVLGAEALMLGPILNALFRQDWISGALKWLCSAGCAVGLVAMMVLFGLGQ